MIKALPGIPAPVIGRDVFVAPNATILGDVHLGDRSSVFFGAVLRGDLMPIRIGVDSNLQEHVLVHTSHHRTSALIGDQVTVGHRAIVHGGKIGNRCLIGMGAIVLDEAVIEDECLIGAGTLIPEGKLIPKHSLVYGSPGKVIRQLSEKEIEALAHSASRYVDTANILRGIDWTSSGI